MKSYFSIVVFFVLLLSSVVTGTDRYLSTEDLIKDDLNQALAHTIAVKGGAWSATDKSIYRLLFESHWMFLSHFPREFSLYESQ
mgnify:CR=1 FL=1